MLPIEIEGVKTSRGSKEGKANAEFIVQAVNNHEALVKALDEFVLLQQGTFTDGRIQTKGEARALKQARAALAKAKGEK